MHNVGPKHTAFTHVHYKQFCKSELLDAHKDEVINVLGLRYKNYYKPKSLLLSIFLELMSVTQRTVKGQVQHF